MNSDKSLVSSSCPAGYYGHYTVAAQDSPAFLASIFAINEEDLLRANPQITSADAWEAGTKIHIPGLIPFPAGINFALANKELPFANGGGAFIHLSPEGGQSVSVIATLPTPSYFGTFDLYIVEVLVTANNIFEGQLFATPDDPPSWAARIDLPFLTSLSPDSQLVLRPFNSLTGNAGDIILQIKFAELPAMTCGASNFDVLSITSEYDLPHDNATDLSDVQLSENSSLNENDAYSEEAEVFDEIEILREEYGNNQQVLADLPAEEDVFAEADILTNEADDDSLQETVDLSAEEDVFVEANILTDEADHDSLQEIVDLPAEEDVFAEANILTNETDDDSLQEIVDLPAEEDVFAEADILTNETDDDSLQEIVDLPAEENLISKNEAAANKRFQPEQILQEISTGKKPLAKYSPYASARQNRKPFNVVLKATAETEQAIGIASIQLQPSQLIIAALKLPDPASLGQQYKFYKAWLVDAGNNKTTAIDMKKILNGVWAGQSSNSTLKAFDLILITAETTQNINEPAGPEVLIGILAADI